MGTQFQPLIVVDGPDYSGKTSVVIPTLIEHLYAKYNIQSYKLVQLGRLTNNVTATYEEVKKLDTVESSNALAMLCYAANMYSNFIDVPLNRLKSHVAVSDRGIGSFYAYQESQLVGTGIDTEKLVFDHYGKLFKPPVLYIYCSVDLKTMAKRAEERLVPVTFDKETEAFKSKVINRYDEFYRVCSDKLGWENRTMLDCRGDFKQVKSAVQRTIDLNADALIPLLETSGEKV